MDLEALTDPAEREAIQTQVACFGQTPPLLFNAAHPARRPVMPLTRPVHWGAESAPPKQEAEPVSRPLVAPPTIQGLAPQGLTTPAAVAGGYGTAPIQPFERILRRQLFGSQGSALALSGIAVCGELSDRRVVAVDANSTVHSFRWPPLHGRAPQVTSARRHCSTQLPSSDSTKTSCVALVAAPDNPRAVHILSGGHFDGALCVAAETGRTLHVAINHSRTITCLALSAGRGEWLLTGAADTTVLLWYLRAETQGHVRPLAVRPLSGHVRELTAVALAAELGLAASGAMDGCVLLHTTRDGSLLRSIAHPDKLPVGHLHLSSLHCRLIVGSTAAGTAALHVFNFSGQRVYGCEMGGGVRCALLSPDGSLVIAGGVRGELQAWRLDTGQPAAIFANAGSGIACACVSESELVIGTQEGDVLGYALDPKLLFGSATKDVAHGFS